MKYYFLPAIVIRRIKIGEADRLIVLLTKELGKITAIAKGVRKITSRRSPHLEIFSHVNVKLRKTLNFTYISEVDLSEQFINIRKNLRQIAAVYHLCEVTDKILPDEDNSHDIYTLLLSHLKEIENDISGNILRSSVRNYMVDLLYELGYHKNNGSMKFSGLINQIQTIIEKPLHSKNLLTLLALDNKYRYLT